MLSHFLKKDIEFQIEGKPFKELAARLNIKVMEISRAVDNLKKSELCEVEGSKVKAIRFTMNKPDLWQEVEKRQLWISPVLKRVFVDEKPKEAILLSSTSALSEYSDMNPSRQKYYAIEKAVFYELQKKKTLVEANEHEGKYCLEVWKYNPGTLVSELKKDSPVVDPLSLYLSLKESRDERIEMALEQIIEKFIW